MHSSLKACYSVSSWVEVCNKPLFSRYSLVDLLYDHCPAARSKFSKTLHVLYIEGKTLKYKENREKTQQSTRCLLGARWHHHQLCTTMPDVVGTCCVWSLPDMVMYIMAKLLHFHRTLQKSYGLFRCSLANQSSAAIFFLEKQRSLPSKLYLLRGFEFYCHEL